LASIHEMLQRVALKLVFWQLIATLVLAFVIAIVQDLNKGLSLLCGGSAYLVPNIVFAWRLFSKSGRLLDSFLSKFMMGEFFKLVVSAVLFVLMVKYLPLNVIYVMLGYIFAIFSFIFICGWHFSRR